MDLLLAAGIGLWVMLPALIPNSAAVLLGGGRPVDLGRSWKGKRILGDGKTWWGLLGGVIFGTFAGLLQILAALAYPADVWMPGAPVNYGFGLMPSAAFIAFLLALGAMLGDIGGAFIKRRRGMGRGEKAPLLDQLDFVVGAWVLVLVFFPNWFLETFIYDMGPVSLVAVLILVPVLHRLINIAGHRLGMKKEPW
jgi:CDP-2,3-bis-(O-geranylgeranyl)-sn-glycerol synthase